MSEILHQTDVAGVNAHDVKKIGVDEFPVFNVSQEEFIQNMTMGRKRLRFKQGSAAQEYHSKTKYNRPFFIRYTDDSGKVLERKIK